MKTIQLEFIFLFGFWKNLRYQRDILKSTDLYILAGTANSQYLTPIVDDKGQTVSKRNYGLLIFQKKNKKKLSIQTREDAQDTLLVYRASK